MSAADALDPNLGFMRNREDTNAEGGQDTNINRSTGVWNQSRTNPALAADCGLDIALVTDTSGSLGATGIADAKTAMGTFVDSFRGTPTRMSLFSFSTISPGSGATNHPTLLPVTTAAQAATFKAQYAGWLSGGGTNWDRGFAAAANSGNTYDLVVLLTDGNPTVFGAAPGAGASAFNSYQDVDAGIFSANQLKATGARVVGLGVGPAVTAASEFNLRAVTGTTEGSDYFRTNDFAAAAQILAQLAQANCQGSIQVQKMIVPLGGTISDAVPAPAGWQFSSSTSATGTAITPATAVTGANGQATFGLAFTPPALSGAVQILETQQSGYELLPVGSGAAARNATCVNSSTGTAVPVNNAGTAATPGITVLGQQGVQLLCTVYNRVLPPPGIPGFTLTKSSAPPSGTAVRAGDTITYTVTGTNTGDGTLNPVTITDDLSDVLNNATLTGTPTASAGAAPTLSGTTLTWTGSLPEDAAVVLTYTVTVNATVPAGTVLNNVASGSAQPPTTPENPVPPITPPPVETEHPVAGFTVTKTADPVTGSTVLGGDTITYTVTGTNTGATALNPVTLTDDLAAVLNNATITGVPSSSTGAAPVLAGTTLTWTGSLPIGGSVTLTYTVTVNPGVPAGTFLNNTVQGSAQPPTTPGNPVPPITPPPVETEHSTPGFTLTKTSDPVSGSTVVGGDTITYTVTGTNTGATVLDPVTLSDDLSDVLNNAAITGTPTASVGAAPVVIGTTLTWTGSLPAGGSVVLTYTVTLNADVAPGTIIDNMASGSAQPPTTPENPVPPIVPPPVATQHPVPGFTLTKTADPVSGTTVVGGDTITYTVTGTNTGATVLDPVTITDNLAEVLSDATLSGNPTASVGASPVVTGTTLTWTGSLPVGGSVVLTYTVLLDIDVPAGTLVSNVASGSAQPPTTPENPVPPIVPPPVETQHPVPGFTLTKTADPVSGSTVVGGDTITYTVTGTNTGGTVLDPVSLTDDLASVLDNATLAGAPTSSVGAAPVVSGTTLTWSGSLPVGGSVTLTNTVTVNAGVLPGTVVNNVASGSAQPPTTPENPVPPIVPPPVETQHPVPGFTLTKTADPVSGSTVVGGDTITYTVTGTNTGATVLDPVTLTDDLSSVLDNATLAGPPTASAGSAPVLTGTTLTWTGSLTIGGSVVLTYTVLIDADVPAGTVLTNVVNGSAQPPTTPENPVPPITPPPVETEHSTPGFTLTKTSDPVSGSTVVGGDTITYTVTGTNTGTSVLNPVVLTDDLSDVLNHAVLTGVPTSSTGAAPVLTGTTLTWTGSLPANGTVVLTYTVTLDADIPAGTIVNNVASGSAQPPTTPENPVPPIVPPPVETQHPVPGFTLTKVSNPISGSTVRGGDTITYTVTGTNTGATVLDPVTLTDDLSDVLSNATILGTPASTVGAAPTLSGTTLTWTGSLPIGGTVTLTYTVTLDADIPAGTVVDNIASGSAQPPTTPENPVPPIVPPPVGTQHPVPGFTLTKTADPVSGSTVEGGDTITYTVTGTNTGATVLNPVTITDDLSDVLNSATLTGTPTASTGAAPVLTGTTLTWTGTLPIGGTVVLSYTVALDADTPAGTVVNNVVNGSAQPPTTPGNPVPPIVPPPVETQHSTPGFTLTKTSDPISGSTVVGGDTITYTVTGTNTGATVLNPVTITDDLSDVLGDATITGTPTSSTGNAPVLTGTTLTWTGSLLPAGTVVLTYTVTLDPDIPAGTVVDNVASGSAQPPTTPENPVPPIVPPPVGTQHPVPGFELAKASDPVSGTAVVGTRTITYTVTGTNTGATVLDPVTITDDLSEVLNNASLVGTPSASTGAAPVVTGTTLLWNGTLPIGGSVVLTYTVAIDVGVEPGTLVNNVASGSAQPPTTPENPVPPIIPPPVETQHPVPGFDLTKTSDPISGTPVVAGDTITYTVTGTNTGATVLDPVTLTDDLSDVLNNATLTGTPTSSTGAAPVLTGTTLSWTGSLPLDGTVVLTYTVTLNPDVPAGTIIDNVASGSAQPPTTPENSVPPIIPPPVETQHPVPGFTVTKTADPVSGSTVLPGDTITYTVTGANTGATVLDPVTLTDDLSDVLTNATLTGTPTSSTGAAPVLTGTTLSWTGALPIGGSVVLTYTVTVDEDAPDGTFLDNLVTGSAQPPTTPENPVPPITPPPVETQHSTPGFTLTKTSDPVTGSTVLGGDTITYTVTGTNTGATVLDPVVITDELADVLGDATLTGAPTASVGAAPVLTGTTLSWTGSLPAQGQVVLTYTVTLDTDVPAGTVVNNHVEGSAQPPTTPENPVPPITPPPVETQHLVPGFELTKTSDPVSGSTVVGSDTITYTVTGTNTGATVLDPVTLTDDLSQVLDNATLTGVPTASTGAAPIVTGTTLLWNGTLAVGQSVTLSYTVTLDADIPAGTIVNNVASGSAQPPTTPENPVPPIIPPPVDTQHPVPGFTLTKTADPISGATVQSGDTITYTVTGTNTGATDLDPVTLTDDLSQVLDNATLTGPPASSTGAAPVLSGSTLTWTGSLPVGGTVVLTYTVTVNDDVPAGTFLLNLVQGSAQPPTTPENPVPPIVPPPVETQHSTPGFTLTKTSDPVSGSVVRGGDTITYTVTGTNTGDGVLDPVVITDDLSQVLVYGALVAAPTSTVGAAPVLTGQTLTWNGSLEAGQLVQLVYSVQLDDDVPGTTVSNIVSGIATPPGGTPIEPPPVSTQHPVPGFTVVKASDPASGSTVQAGDTITYTVTATNTGATVLNPVVLDDDLSGVFDHATLVGAPQASQGAAVINGDRLQWTGSLGLGAQLVITYQVVVEADVAAGSLIRNTVTSSAVPVGPPGTPTGPPIVPPPAVTEHPVPGFVLTKSSDVPDGATVAGGDTITYTVTGTNIGAALLDPVVITDDMARVLNNATLVGTPAASLGAAPTLTGTTLTWTGALAAGEVVTVTYRVLVNAGVAAGTPIDNLVSAVYSPPGQPPVRTPDIIVRQVTEGAPPASPVLPLPPPLAHTGVNVPGLATTALILLFLGGLMFVGTGRRRRTTV